MCWTNHWYKKDLECSGKIEHPTIIIIILHSLQKKLSHILFKEKNNNNKLKMLFTKVSLVCALAAFATAADVTITSTKVNTAT
ncbi:hypothetical protein PSV08DRAFT_286393, partial [Bipolaris maydis]